MKTNTIFISQQSSKFFSLKLLGFSHSVLKLKTIMREGGRGRLRDEKLRQFELRSPLYRQPALIDRTLIK